MAAIDVIDWGTNYITVEVTGMTKQTNYANYIEFYRDNRRIAGLDIDSGEDTSYEFRSLSPGTSYRLAAIVYHKETNGTMTALPFANNYVDWSTDEEVSIYVEPWDWQATSAMRSAYNAIMNGGNISAFKYEVWNLLIDKIEETLSASDDVWSTGSGHYLSSSQAKMTSTDKTLTARRFNSVRYNIGLHASTGYNDFVSGQPVLGEYFIAITDALNRWIDSVNDL